ncbi:MAG: response regulator [Vibrio sp.]
MDKVQILIVEDEPTLAQILAEYLTQAGFEPHILSDGLAVIDWVKSNSVALIILDLMLPGRDGLDIYRELRTFSHVPVMMATAKVEEIDRLLGLELGADDYICKPYSAREVVARVKNVLRRSQMAVESESKSPQVIEVNSKTMQARYFQQNLTLTPAEFQLLSVFVKHPSQVFNRDQLMQQIYPDHRVVFDRTIDTHIKNLRKKLQQVEPSYNPIKSVYGIGYKFELA